MPEHDLSAQESAAIGIICAIPDEIAQFGDAFQKEKSTSFGGFDFAEGLLEGKRCILVEAGMGKVNAAVVATILAQNFNCRSLLFSGVAGGLDPALGVGDVVIGKHLIQHDYGIINNEVTESYHPGHLPIFMPSERFGYHLDGALHTRIEQALKGFVLPELSAEASGGTARTPTLQFGTILTGDQFVNCTATRNRLHNELGGQAVEMEGAAVAQVAERFGVDWLVVRSLSDLAGEESGIDFIKFLHETAAGAAIVLRRLITVL
ncbi:5'-methylthioadenosine/adenosylhomocysteine nucleosidase [Pelagibius sp. Alg239-R121]|uniref:5'-methylthioadenosine/adenosylhomocysteine nucleosidase n=1 Tax=Pelagibius sp. Alg239-R121 TaxID=2993448 RepID=UPI0024A6B7F0|nr:5'-methylthioadenosine/adenosylhomocysteine nucleosidase [Pelagibius sp. Alg239-R121]